MNLEEKMRELRIALKENMIEGYVTVVVRKRDHWIALLDALQVWDRLSATEKRLLYDGSKMAVTFMDYNLEFHP